MVLHNRIGWARTYLNKEGLIHTVRRATFIITEEGKQVLSDPDTTRIDNKFLMQYEKFREFKYPNNTEVKENSTSSPDDTRKTPRELLEDNYKLLKEETKSDLLYKVMESFPAFFERLIVKLFVSMGYGNC